ncbi:unnamed protein product [Blepharisma stoltei]|uniref:Uncharacterized protein n=1 Tax=Blepharisma stoltei TaxID=1481888 RepID=A0AAU9I458_9CILI|nr:unnamed protein product [Blepharisma stoltei]
MEEVYKSIQKPSKSQRDTEETRLEEALKNPMKPIIEAHTELQTAYKDLDVIIDDVVSRNEWILNNKYLDHLHQQEAKLHNLKEKLVQANFEIENNPEVYRLNEQMKSYTNQYETLSRFSAQLKAQENQYRSQYSEEEKQVMELKQTLKELSKENLKLSYQLEEIKPKEKSLDNLKSKMPQIFSKYSQSNLSQIPTVHFELMNQDQQLECYHLIEDVENLKKDIYKIRDESQNLGSLQGAFLNEQRKLELFFQECLNSAKQELLKNQQMPQISKQGLAGSLFFELVHSEQANNRTAPTGFLKDRSKRSALQERDCKNVVYYTVKRMMRTARDETRNQQLSKLKLPWKDFHDFSTLQLMGLLCMRTDILMMLHQTVFPANVLHLVAREDVSPSPKPTPNRKSRDKKRPPRELSIRSSKIGKELMMKHRVA